MSNNLFKCKYIQISTFLFNFYFKKYLFQFYKKQKKKKMRKKKQYKNLFLNYYFII